MRRLVYLSWAESDGLGWWRVLADALRPLFHSGVILLGGAELKDGAYVDDVDVFVLICSAQYADTVAGLGRWHARRILGHAKATGAAVIPVLVGRNTQRVPSIFAPFPALRVGGDELVPAEPDLRLFARLVESWTR